MPLDNLDNKTMLNRYNDLRIIIKNKSNFDILSKLDDISHQTI